MPKPLTAMLDAYASAWPHEADTVTRIRTLVAEHANCFDRDCLPGHVTGSAWVLSADRRRCLLVHHRKLDRWLQPGGHADGDSDVVRVAAREACEESGLKSVRPLLDSEPLDVDVHLIPARYDAQGGVAEPEHEHHDVRFLFVAEKDTPLIVSDESHDVRWFTPREVQQLTDEESVLRMLKKAERWMQG